VEAGLPDDLLFRTLAEIGAIERRLGRDAAAVEVFTDLAASPNPYRAHAFTELAKHYEHRERNYALALEMTRSARQEGDSPELEHCEGRLVRRLRTAPKAKTRRKR